MSQRHVPRPGHRQLVEVLVDGRWIPAELHGWFPSDEGGSYAQVYYQPEPGLSQRTMIDAERVRPEESPPG